MTQGNSAPTSSPAFLPSLEGLRGMAIILVLIHTSNILKVGEDAIGVVVARVAGFGWIGVQLFFVLSGFLITKNLLQMQGSVDYFRIFFARRILRIFPLYYATLAFFFIILPCIGYAPKAIQDDQPNQLWLWLFLSNWTSQLGLGGLSLPHFWSLAVEEQFYLLWPFVVVKRSPSRVLRICMWVVVLSFCVRVWMTIVKADPLQIYTFSICRMDALAYGAAIATLIQMPSLLGKILLHRKWLPWMAGALVVIGKLIPNGFGMTDPIGQTIGYSILALIFAILIAYISISEHEQLAQGLGFSLLRSKIMRTMGRYSFSAYLFHAPLNSFLGPYILDWFNWRVHPTTLQGILYVSFNLVATFFLSWLAFHLVEKHFMALKRFFVPDTSVTPA